MSRGQGYYKMVTSDEKTGVCKYNYTLMSYSVNSVYSFI